MTNFTRILKNDDEEYEFATRAVDNLCSSCERLNLNNPVTCEAFPDGIPVVIILGVYDHHYPYDMAGVDDDGLVYSPRD